MKKIIIIFLVLLFAISANTEIRKAPYFWRLNDVDTTGTLTGNTLYFNSATGKWEPVTTFVYTDGTTDAFTFTGKITADSLIGDGSQLTGIRAISTGAINYFFTDEVYTVGYEGLSRSPDTSS